MVGIKGMEMPKSCAECRVRHECKVADEWDEFDWNENARCKGCPLVEVKPLTDTEKRLFLSAVGREEDICKKIDSEKELKDLGVKELAPIVRSIERKVKKALWA